MTIRRLATGSALGCLLAGSSGCWVPAETGAKMQAEINDLQRKTEEANRALDEQRARREEQMQRAEKQIDDVATALADLRRAARGTDAEFGLKIERLIREVQELRGTAELAEYKIGKLEGKLEGDGSIIARLDTLERELKDVSIAPTPPAKEEPKNKRDLLVHARKLAKAGKIAEARGVFREIIKRWPDEAGVTDECYFRLGELYFNEKKYRSALQEYIKVAEKFASGRYVAAALYKIGLSSMGLGNLEDAQIFFKEVVKNHRRSSLYKDSGKKLEEIKLRLEKEKKTKKSSGKSKKSGGKKK